MKKYKTKPSHRIIALFFTITFLQTLIPYNQLWANNNGPNAPEAAAFEPVDATDMVNLLTGDFSYVLPLLNIPSPEGGYPLALSYHGGVAHNQEASWTGLGWNLNPGSINRNINGFPDDWGKTKYEEFFYDAGWEENEYNFSLGININGFNIGQGVAWGSHRSTGGFVSLGYGLNDVGANVTVASEGSSIGFGYQGFNVNIGTNGVGIGYGSGFKNSELSYGISLNYNYNSSLSGGLSLAGTESNKSSKSILKSTSVGISFSSNGPSLNGSINGKGGGISTANFGVSSDDYNVKVDGFQSSIPVYIFYVGFGHKRITYSLFKKNNLTTSGSVYPYHANETKSFSNGSEPSYLMKENYFMDVNEFPAFSHKNMSLDYLVEQNYKIDKNNISLPGYDNYTVTSQGLSGSIKPASYYELNLVDRGRAETNNDNIYTAYVADNFDSYLDETNDLGGTTHFYFENEINSFLRLDRTNIYKNATTNGITNPSDKVLLEGFETSSTSLYNQQIAPNGDQLKSGNRKRTGNYIETFTNKQIRDDNTVGFIEAKNINRNGEIDTFLDEGIGAFKITALDGKTYHYSLPVYNFETFYKNFKTENQENTNFFEIKKTKPYATHWLLTAVTGPDYVDINTNGQVDKEDYGYWVEFDYGKWSDGYVWKGPFDGYEEHENKEDPNDKTYSYYWGRKQIYYLDAVKTRSHTALFVKDLRADNTSKELNIYKKLYTGGTFKADEYSEEIQSGKSIYISPTIGEPGDVVYKGDGNTYTLPDYPFMPVHSGSNYKEVLKGIKMSSKYIDIPKNRLLKLSKIILLKNDQSNIDKGRGNITSTLTGYLSINNGYKNIQPCEYDTIDQSTNICAEIIVLSNGYLDPIILKSFQIHQQDKVLDIKDIEGLNLEEQAAQVIDFNYDYSLAQQSLNSVASTKGRLSLKSVDFAGKKGISLVPPYKFNYNLPYVTYNKENQDEWGYHKTNPEAWSLNEITTPTGGKIKINHEADSYYSEAAYNSSEIFNNAIINKNENSDIIEIEFLNSSINLNEYFNLNVETNLFLNLRIRSIGGGNYNPNIEVKVTNIDNSNNKLTVQVIKYEDDGYNYHINNIPISNLGRSGEFCHSSFCFSKPSIKSTKTPNLYYTDTEANGKTGGGIRVASIEVKGENTTLKTVYDYTNLDDDNISGITSYAPSEEQKGIPYVSELPAPLITYGNVTMKNYDQNNRFLGSTSYEFDVLQPYEEHPDYIFCLGDFFKVEEQQNESFFDGEVKAKKYTIYNKISDIGRVLSIASHNKNGQLLNKTVSSYKTNLDNDGQIGVSQQSYKSIKKLQKNNEASFLITSSSKIDYPSVLESTTTSQGGFTNTTYYDNHDFLTGQVMETRTVSSEGTEFKTKITPAYQVSNYTDNTNGYSMGAKVDNPTNKNMLTQTAASLTKIKDASGDWKIMNASVDTWNDDWTYRSYNGTTSTPSNDAEKIWRKHQTFAWKGEVDDDGAYAGYTGNDDNFNWLDPDNQSNAEWIKTSEVSLYDHYSMPLESIDINGNKASTKMGDDNSKVFAVANASYTAMYYSGAEDLIENTSYFSGEVSKGSTATLSDTYHTGSKAIQVSANVKAFSVQPEGGNYKVSVWAYKGNNTSYTNTKLRAGSTVISYHPAEVIPAGDWVQLNFYTGDIAANQEVYIYNSLGTAIYDDFRMVPIASSMSSYVYNEWDELTYIIGANNLATKYEYDDAGRLKRTYAEVMDTPEVTGGFKLSKEINYNYGTPISSNTTNPNALSVSLGISNPNVSTTTLTATASGGSYEYQYRWAISSNNSSFSFGGWTSSSTTSLTTSCGIGGRRYYKCEVRDKNSGTIVTGSGNHQRGNCGNGGGDPDNPILIDEPQQ
ncbi:hypothetical protein D1818_15140 [Aquimarina sp. BL5]|uniref:hypothetical protein n=1 Tax=Aquimarina sp. BL5 TaxID=1714860 RepID=UPI000E46944F|nr:hypothetical protein [Aquimarina sp. BL5]AXT52109.1 hypothetical protein D1818_15140 [Aquimarina sp. BL5]RKN10765.1 hypothetical protein D7036_01805 [Aquimarina sp. BL5]